MAASVSPYHPPMALLSTAFDGVKGIGSARLLRHVDTDIEARPMLIVQRHHLAVYDAALEGHDGSGQRNRPMACRPVAAVMDVGSHAAVVLDDLRPVAVPLDLGDPAPAGDSAS